MAAKKIGLALSSGGLFGFAHIGVIEVLEEQGIRPSLIAGSSSGAIIGLVYAAGGMALLEKFVSRLEETGLLTKKGIFSSWTPDRYFSKVGLLLEELVKEKDLKQLGVPFFPVATDVATGAVHIFESGSPIEAVLASATYPVALSTKEIDHHYYIDGGLTCYLPSEELEKRGARTIIGSVIQVVDELPNSKIKNINSANLVIRSIEILQERLSQYQLESCDYVIRPKFNPTDWHQVDRLNYLIETGRKAARAKLAEMKLITGRAS
ncbi:MAG TPA: patatin-like phospholipase family protein [Candidatus Saccharimonadales bacterium]|nr:patatin-like phospholipase family protein [Candidatus Saccharimonadales bacterium]